MNSEVDSDGVHARGGLDLPARRKVIAAAHPVDLWPLDVPNLMVPQRFVEWRHQSARGRHAGRIDGSWISRLFVGRPIHAAPVGVQGLPESLATGSRL
ncbi:hypothetical protein J2X06_003022 [Lysobacter niastensis]|uniref:Uncharacterized protein n=1 Tax=Lysobacter niastensis TaxID=380629 RepID=A0ABU1WEI4_9GAMM|nr:hypothetical protein [Lysobacter niastensis]MDR7135804.1 hypothetical protein [Lysobacter niastensis]